MKYDALTALLANTLDYAGTAPPLKLPLEEALAEVARVQREAKAPWFLSRVVLSMEELKRLDAKTLLAAGHRGGAWHLTTLGTAPRTADEDGFLGAIEFDLRELEHSNARFVDSAARTLVTGYEAKLPEAALAEGNTDHAFEYLAPALDRFSSLARSRIDPVFEAPLHGEWQKGWGALTEALAQWREDDSEARVVPGVKMRLGGDQTPKPEAVAEAISLSVGHGLRLKATQGLHHAISTEKEFGFVNLLVAVHLATSLGREAFGAGEIAKCLAEKERAAFRFTPEAVEWRGKSLSITDIERGRKLHGLAFGSCSFSEPEEEWLKLQENK